MRSGCAWHLLPRDLPLVPTQLLTGIKEARSQRAQASHIAPLPLTVLEQYSVDDLFYDDQNLDRALDLLAICFNPL